MTSLPLKIGFVGLGIMGAPMAGQLIKAGHQLFVFTRSKMPESIAQSSATQCLSAREVAEKADIIITMVPDTPDVEAVLFAENGIAAGLSKGKVVVDMSSVSPIATKVFAQKINTLGCEYLDAPVSGGEVGAKAASLTIMVGGTEAAFSRVLASEAAVRPDGQEHHAGRRQRRRPDLQGGEPDHRGDRKSVV